MTDASLQAGDRVCVSGEGVRNRISMRKNGKPRVGTVVNVFGDSVEVKWDGNLHASSIYGKFVERVRAVG